MTWVNRVFNKSCERMDEIPDGVDYEIAEYDGSEHVAEKHRSWH